MILEILDMKAKGKNIPLNELIKKHSDITTDVEDENLHYTLIELCNVRGDSNMLLDEPALINFIGANCPVGFDPDFEFGEELDKKIRETIDDYETVSIKVGDIDVYKPYITPSIRPQYAFVWEGSTIHEEEDDLIAFCWYCQNKESEQFKDKEKSGLLFKLKNFTVGDRFLTREKLWASTPERAFWFFGEVYINDRAIVPTSERNNFVQNDARERLYKEGKTIGKTLSKIVGTFSEETRAVQKIDESATLIAQIESDYECGRIAKDFKLVKVVAAYRAVEEVENRLNKAPTESHKQRGRDVIKKGRALILKLENPSTDEKVKNKIYDIPSELGFSEQSTMIYTIIIRAISDSLIDNPGLNEAVIKNIHSALKEKLK